MLKYLKKYWPLAIGAACFMVLEVCADLFQPRMMEQIVNQGILGLGNHNQPNLALVTALGVRMILVVIGGGLSGIMCGVLTNICGQNYGNEVRKACFDRIIHLSFQQTEAFSAGSLITRITSDVTQVQNLLMQMTRGMVRCLMFLIGGSIALLSLDLSFSRIIAIAVPLILIEIAYIVWRTSPLFSVLQSRLDRMNSVIRENIAGVRVVKAFVQEKRELKRFEDTSSALVETQLEVLIRLAWLRPFMNIILNLATVAVLLLGAGRVKAGLMAPGTIMAAITYLSQILNGMMMLAMLFQTLSRGFASAGRLKEVLAAEPAIQDGTGTPPEPAGAIAFEHVSFHYPDNDAPVLTDISFTAEPGEFLAIIGSTGSGKSSLVQLIPRFYDTVEGRVTVDGMDVRDYPLAELRNRISYVLQKSELFSSTIKENIAIGQPDATPEAIRSAARIAQADSFIMAQPEQYDTAIAERGMSLSGGQRQRIAIARALLKPASILIFDDATSALDVKTEAAFRDALKEARPGVTKLMIAQRISSVMHADRIIVIDEGKVAGIGTHEALMQSCAVYQDIFNSQLKGGEDHA
ncbi:MAG: ABC transporter ATP-binding protein [Solobacterium sp.]|nr:ABC transporter ATP-binding protein [Solobacterium sp.]